MMKKRTGFLVFLLFSVITISFSNEYTDQLLDDSIEEFSKKNYVEALEIIESVLVIEPENDIANMYKKTIEDVIILDGESEQIVLEDSTLTTINTTVNNVDDVEITTNLSDYYTEDFFSLSLYIGENSNGLNYLNHRMKIILGLPIIDIRLTSSPFDFDISTMSFEDIPFDEIFNIEDYNIDLSIGLRYKPFQSLNLNTGFFDIKTGVTSFSSDEDYMIPYVGFDTEVFLLTVLADNFLTNSFWFGGGGAIYNYNGEFINNYSAEFKIGVKSGPFNVGWFYNVTNLNSEVDADIYNYGMILGVTY